MLKQRLIVNLVLRNGVIVQSKRFKFYQWLGDPTTIVERLSNWTCDEVVYLDISSNEAYDLKRDDLNTKNRKTILDIIQDVSKKCFMPLTFGGRIRTIEDIRLRLQAGADKVTLNTQAFVRPEFISEAALEFGSQCIVVSMDAKEIDVGKWEIYSHFGKKPTGKSPAQWAREVEERGAGEIFLNSIDRDGTGQGYDLELIQSVTAVVKIPVIACGGVGEWRHLAEGLKVGGASAVAAANIFHYTENSVYNAKKFLCEQGCNVREPIFSFQERVSRLIG